MIKNIRSILQKNKALYGISKKYYNVMRRIWMRLALSLRRIKYLEPKRVGGVYYSQFGQEFYLEELGLLSRGGYFVEVGCNHPIINSNSHFLEHQCDFEGISIDAIDYSKEFESERPNTRFVRCIVDKEHGQGTFYHVRDEDGWENQVSSVHKETLTMGKGFKADTIELEKIPLRDLVDNEKEIDVLLIDVEGHEFSVLDSLDWNISKPRAIVVENNGDFYPRKEMEIYMSGKGYNLFARIGVSDDIYIPKR